jgi:hypothetical protein
VPDSHLILLEAPGGYIALTPEELQTGYLRAAEIAPPVLRGGSGPAANGEPPVNSDGLLDADGMAAATGVPASWFATAARANKISYVGFGRWIRFDFEAVVKEMAQARKAADPEPAAPKLPPSRKHKLNRKGT